MKIFPAIDIKDKKCVRLIKGDFDNKTEYATSPIDQAEKYKDHGFKNLHIVDLDGALTGETVNLDIIEEIITKYDLKIEIGGHTDDVGGDEYNMNLSLKRSYSVYEYLTSKGGVDNLSYKGYGNTKPREDKVENSQNRRIEFKIL